MYQALYRKYRPSDFNDVVGQKIIVETLKNSILKNKITHAYLFTGPRGTGKTSIAKIFAKTINCENLDEITPCNMCVSCTQINNKTSTDIIEIDAASNNGIDEIREIKSKIDLAPNSSKYKVYIIDEVHMLTTGAFNALLKTLEEPPSHVIFILATTDPQKIPSTILSRCQRYDFKKISISEIVERLKYICENEKINISEEALNEIARISDGGMRDSISILDQVSSYKNEKISLDDVHAINGTLTQKELEKFVNNLLQNNIEIVFNLLDEYNNNGKNLMKLVDEIIIYLRNALLYYEVPNYLISNNIDTTPYKNLKDKIDINKIYKLINNFNDLSLKLKNTSNVKILFEMEILNNIDIKNNKNISREIKIDDTNLKNKDINNEKIKNNDEYNKKISEIKKIRINNILAKLNKKNILSIKENMKKLTPYLLDKKFGKFTSLLLDGNIKACSDEGLIYMYESEVDSKLFNDSILILQNMIKKILKTDYNLISVSISEWDKIKNEYNTKSKQYVYSPETFDLKEIYSLNTEINNDEMIKLFDEIVEYTKEEI